MEWLEGTKLTESSNSTSSGRGDGSTAGTLLTTHQTTTTEQDVLEREREALVEAMTKVLGQVFVYPNQKDTTGPAQGPEHDILLPELRFDTLSFTGRTGLIGCSLPI